jgi:quercetin dioxygenase-like cupin family protein
VDVLFVMKASYVRLFTDDRGESHFQDVIADLPQVDFADGIPPLSVSESFAASEASFFGAPAGWKSDWHPSSGRHLFAVFSGVWEVTASDGETRTFSQGDVLLVEDTTGKGHMSKVVGKEDSLSLLVVLGTV